MPLSTYSELQASLADWLARDNLTAQIPDFIALAEARMNREVDHWQMEKRASREVSSQYMALPDDFSAIIRLHLEGDQQPLRQWSIHEVQRNRYLNQGTAGQPCAYALTAGEIELVPAPDTTYNVELTYRRKIVALSDANTSNWILDEHPDLYLYGSLLASAPFLVEDERLVTWGALYRAAIESVNYEAERAKFSGAKRKRLRTA